MIFPVIILGSIGLVIGVCLAIASKVFYVYVDPKVEAVDAALPGANCGGCGLPGCTANAEAIVQGKASPASCVAAGPELGEEIAGLLGVSIEAREPDIARTGCTYSTENADTKYFYDGINDCRAGSVIAGGIKVCAIGCLGLGSCVRACPFDAMTMGPDGLPVVIEEKCTGCGTCEKTCPRNIINLTSVTRRILLEYTTDHCTTPCQRACPAGIDIKKYISRITEGDYAGAVQVIKERNPFPTVIGRICPRPCELECRRKFKDEPVAINSLKKFAADFERDSGEHVMPFKAPDTGRRIAVVGGGVSGLSAAFFMARLGHSPHLFEAGASLGGLLRSAIAKERLSDEILDFDIEGVLKTGVTAHTGKTLGIDFTAASLLEEGFEAVYISTGGWDGRLARKADYKSCAQIPGTRLLIDLIKDGDQVECKGRNVIAGGGVTALDAAKLCFEKGAAGITILLREDEEEIAEKLGETIPDGVEALYSTAVTKLSGAGDELEEIQALNLKTGESQTLEAKTLFIAAGRLPALVFKRLDVESADKLHWEGTEIFKNTGGAGDTGFLAAGDEISDYSAAIRAIAAGRRGAAATHAMIYDIEPFVPQNVITAETVVQNVEILEHVPGVPRNIPAGGCEPEKSFDAETAGKEAARCLKCGLICYEKRDESGAVIACSA